MSRFLRVQAIVLKRTNYGEADKIINFLTTDGQISALAKSVRKAGNKLAGALEPFSVVELVLVKGRGDVYRITGAHLLQHFHAIVASYERLELAYYFIKSVSRLSRDIDSGAWFVILKQTLEALNNPALDSRLIKAWFNFQAAALLGEEFNLELASDGQLIALDQKYSYDISQKSLICDPNGRLTGDVLRLLKALNMYDLPTVYRIKNAEAHLDLILSLSIAHLSLE